MDALPTVPAVSIIVYLYSCIAVLQPCVVLHAVRFLCVPTSYSATMGKYGTIIMYNGFLL